ncbi:hypothetical protein [Streptomyces sp. NPDC057682]|uniref:hypothetical protein n=1 Tax=unclassified Streptomyces TaxID=2593676 RepID=UPI003667FB26
MTGAALCAVLAVIVACWLVRDVRAVEIDHLWRYWAGWRDSGRTGVPTTSASDVVLLVVYAATAVAALSSAVAGSALVAAGVVTLAVRLPGVWTIGSTQMEQAYSDELRSRALICAFVALAAGIGLFVTAGAGRRPTFDTTEELPGKPGPGAAVTTFLLLGAAGAVLLAWEIRHVVVRPDLFPDWYVGGEGFGQALTDPPPGWAAVAPALLALYIAGSALAPAVHTRPFGLMTAALLLVSGGLQLIWAVHEDVFDHFGSLGTENQLMVASWGFETFVALVVLLVLSPRGLPEVNSPYDPGTGYGTPGYDAPGYGYPPAGPSSYARDPGARPHTPGYGYPQGGGGFGPPPPPSQPPPGW